MLRTGGVLTIVTTALLGVTACAPQSAAELDPNNRPTMAPEQTTSDACAQSKAAVDTLVEQMQQQLSDAGQELASGKIPNMDGFVQQLQDSAQRLGDNVNQPEVLDALEAVRAEVDGFAEITAPESLLGVPGYLNSLGDQLSQLQASGRDLQELCSAG